MWALLSTTQDVAHVETEALRARMDANKASGRWLGGVALVMTAVGTALLAMFLSGAVGTALLAMFLSGMLVLFRPGWNPGRTGDF